MSLLCIYISYQLGHSRDVTLLIVLLCSISYSTPAYFSPFFGPYSVKISNFVYTVALNAIFDFTRSIGSVQSYMLPCPDVIDVYNHPDCPSPTVPKPIATIHFRLFYCVRYHTLFQLVSVLFYSPYSSKNFQFFVYLFLNFFINRQLRIISHL